MILSSLNYLVESFLRVLTGDGFLSVNGSFLCILMRTFLSDLLLVLLGDCNLVSFTGVSDNIGRLFLGTASCFMIICCSDFLNPNIVALVYR